MALSAPSSGIGLSLLPRSPSSSGSVLAVILQQEPLVRLPGRFGRDSLSPGSNSPSSGISWLTDAADDRLSVDNEVVSRRKKDGWQTIAATETRLHRRIAVAIVIQTSGLARDPGHLVAETEVKMLLICIERHLVTISRVLRYPDGVSR